jgi:hypothetical protein
MKNEKKRINVFLFTSHPKINLHFSSNLWLWIVNKNLKLPKQFVSPHIIEGIDNKYYYQNNMKQYAI